MGPFKKGPFTLAIESEVPVMPISVSGSYSVMPPHQFKITPGRITICFHPPISTMGMSLGDRESLTDRVWKTIASGLTESEFDAQDLMPKVCQRILKGSKFEAENLDAMTPPKPITTAQLAYSLLCDDIRLEAGNKLSLMGIFQNVYFQSLPSTILKFALLNHWVGNGEHTTEIKIISPDRNRLVLQTAPSTFTLETGGFADNVTFFTNV